eukprot:CAMPEP_0174265186 /NCGR_PEP_ID=MMETSP0439-20130205/25524_1 /TAXON_ID=0 /ORGANISM="Stereomyxa ramosa, Strain Chinc5" /LENGTH=66 /DNA_ID=CAMNT_0015351507 /DNA_START=35 /DNA_END=232 /DNA_ORIENTATION=+
MPKQFKKGSCRVFSGEEEIEATCGSGHTPKCWLDSNAASLHAECGIDDDRLPSLFGSLWDYFHGLF